jgi:phospholipid/cholesterol/gamma-HCH transport system permease protein
MNQIAGYIGRKTIDFVKHVVNMFAFVCRMSLLFFNRPTEGREVMRRNIVDQIYFTAVEPLPIIVLIALIMGSTFIVQFTRFTGQYDLGKVMVLLVVRELGPVITAILVTLRSATAVTAHISYMNVLDELDAIEMVGIDPMRYVCLPRLIGITTAILCLFIVFDLVAILGGYATVWMVTHVEMGNLLGQIGEAITVTDIVVGIVKALSFGIAITVICLDHGFSSQEEMSSIPQNTARASVESFFVCLVINVIISILFYL